MTTIGGAEAIAEWDRRNWPRSGTFPRWQYTTTPRFTHRRENTVEARDAHQNITERQPQQHGESMPVCPTHPTQTESNSQGLRRLRRHTLPVPGFSRPPATSSSPSAIISFTLRWDPHGEKCKVQP
uniref:Uncharacterized protein n=1 Tax=Anopheles coluzzii TaxID=1518534 RepID=A0A8W7PSU3_ANOCL